MSKKRKISLLEVWLRNQAAHLKEAENLKLWPQQLASLRDPEVISSLVQQNVKMVSLLPPAGTDVFRRFTPESLAVEDAGQTCKKGQTVEISEEDLPKPSKDLEAGKSLPFIYGDPPPGLLNVPLEELDPYYKSKKTFNVISKANTINRFNADPACYIFSPLNPIRRVAIWINSYSLFSVFIMLTVLLNCMFLLINPGSQWRNIMEYVFISIYTFEVLIKVLSRGFCIGHFTYLRDPWNCLDFFVVIMAYITEFADFGNVSVLGILRLIRVLKIFTITPGMKKTVDSVVQSVRRLGLVVIMTVFCLVVFTTIAIQLFMGSLLQKCVRWPPPSFNRTADTNRTFDFDTYRNNEEHYYTLSNYIEPLLCGSSDTRMCPEGYVCMRAGRNPNYGFTNYDTFGWAFLSLLRLMTQDYWENLLYLTLQAEGKTYVIFFIVTLFVFSFCLVSLILAAVAMAYAEMNEATLSEAKRKKAAYVKITEELTKHTQSSKVAKSIKSKETMDLIEGPGQHNRKASGVSDASQPLEELEKLERRCSPCWYKFADIFLKWNCCTPWVRFKKLVYSIVMDPFVDLAITICIIINVVFLAMEHYPMTADLEMTLAIGSLVFLGVYTVEMILKIIAMDPYHYFQDGWNILDCLIVVLGFLELFIANVEGMSVFRAFRLMRICRLGKPWSALNFILNIFGNLFGALRNLSLILTVFVIIFAALGMQLFGQDYRDKVCQIAEDCQLPRWHMADFFHSFLIVFRILCGEWIETMWDCMEVSGPSTCIVFYMVVVVIGKLLVLNLFLALLLKSFSGDMALSNAKKNNLQIAKARIARGINWVKAHISPALGLKSKDDEKKGNTLGLNSMVKTESGYETKEELNQLDDALEITVVPIVKGETDYLDDTVSENDEKNDEKKKLKDADDLSSCITVDKVPELENTDVNDEPDFMTPGDCCSERCIRFCPCVDVDITKGRGKKWWNFRKTCRAIVEHSYFEIFITLVIILSSGLLAFEDIYIEQRTVLKIILENMDQIVTCIFVLEMLLKWFAYGCKTYFTNAWCLLDFFIVNIYMIGTTSYFLGFSTLQLINCLRPLRILSRFERMRVVVKALLGSIPSMFNVMVACTIFWLIFCIMGVNLFAGKFYYCFNTTTGEYFTPDIVNNKTSCFELILDDTDGEVQWLNAKINFDNVFMGYLALFQVATFKGWLDIMYAAMDSRMVEDQPLYEDNIYVAMYFIIFTIFGSFITLILFVGVIIDNFNKQKSKLGQNPFITENQKKYYDALKKRGCMEPQKPIPRPQKCLQAFFYDIVTKESFEILMVGLIFLHMLTLTVERHNITLEAEEILFWTHMIFNMIFTAECVFKLIALRKYFFHVGWNIFDFILVILTILGVFLRHYLEKYFVSPRIFSVIRLARIGRILPLIRAAKGIRRLLFSLMMSFPAIFNICLVFSVIMFIYSIFGMNSFAYVKKGGGIGDMFNFETFGNSILSLFVITTTAGWDGLLAGILQSTPPDCDPNFANPGSNVRGNCGNPGVGIIFFCTYVVISLFVVVNMYVVVITENFSIATEKSSESYSEEKLMLLDSPSKVSCKQEEVAAKVIQRVYRKYKVKFPHKTATYNVKEESEKALGGALQNEVL